MSRLAIRLASDDLYPRDEAHRFRLYALEKDGTHVVRACAPDPAGLGLAIITIAEERREAGLGPEVIGILDAVTHSWITTPWAGRS